MSTAHGAAGDAAPVEELDKAVPDPARPGSAHRLVAFSDGVFAVIITILVLALRPPAGTGYSSLLRLWPTAVSYAISYLFIAIVWLNHHHLMRHAPPVSTNLVWANFTHLFSVSLVPFATSWVADSRLAGAPLSLYAIIFAVANASYLVLCWEVMDRPMLGDEEIRRFMRMRAWITLGLFAVAAAVAVLSPVASVVIIVFCLALYIRPEARPPAGRMMRRRTVTVAREKTKHS
jgi:uncharacterized membrane protein